MQCNRTDSTPVRDEQSIIESGLMTLLLSPMHPGPWTRTEVQREMGERFGVTDALAALNGAGLIHIEGELVLASRTARRMDELDL